MSDRSRQSPPWRAALILCLILFAYYVWVQRDTRWVTGWYIGGDGFYTHMWARSLAFDGDLRLTNDYQICNAPLDQQVPVGPGLEVPNLWGVGTGVLVAPFVLLGRLLFRAAKDSADPTVAGGCYGPIAETGMAGVALLAAATLFFGYRLARRHTSEHGALAAIAIVGLASPLCWYATAQPAYNHVPSAFVCALFVERWDAGRHARTLGGWVVLGWIGGFMMTVRLQCGAFLVLPLLEWLTTALDPRRARHPRWLLRHLVGGVLFSCAMVLAFSPQLYVWKITFGSLRGESHIAHGYMRWRQMQIMAPLFFPYSGLFSNSPLLVPGMLALLASLRRKRLLVGGLFLALTANLLVISAAWDWWGAAGYPGRRFTDDTCIFVLGTALAYSSVEAFVVRAPKRAVALVTALVVGCAAIWTRNYPFETDGVAPSADHYADWFRRTGRWVDDTTGNPLAWPGSLPFAIRYRTHPGRWDEMASFAVTYESPATHLVEWNVLSAEKPAHELFFANGFGPPRMVDGRRARIACGRARLIFPLFSESVRALQFEWSGVGGSVGFRLNRVTGLIPAPPAGFSHVQIPPNATRAALNELVLVPPGNTCLALYAIRFES